MAPSPRSWGARIARSQDEALADVDLERQRRRFLSRATRGRAASEGGVKRRRLRVEALVAAALGAVAAVSVLAVLRVWTARPLSFEVGGARGK